MVNHLPYWIFFGMVICQRMAEVLISHRHAQWMIRHGGREFGRDHFKWIVLLMAAFFIGVPLEHWWFETRIVSYWPILTAFFLLAQLLRYWAMASLGKRWNVRIWVIHGEPRIVRGPYRWIRHPNYIAVAIELLVIPWMIGCYRTSVLSFVGYLAFLRVRLRTEETALNLPMERTLGRLRDM